MKKVLLLLALTISAKAFCQQHWEDNFWREKAKERYARTLTMAGLYTEFYSDGKIKWQGKCLENGNPDSVWVWYDEKGNKLWEGEYTGKYYEYTQHYDYDHSGGVGEDTNVSRTYWDTSIVGNYKNGLKDGEWKEYDYNGKFISKKGHYKNGEPTGIWQEFQEETVATEVLKTAEYDYTTQTRTLYKRDSIDGTSHIDSLNYDDAYGINGRNGYNHHNSPYSQDDVMVNLTFIGTAQLINLSPLNNYFYQPGYSKLDGPLESVGFEWAGTNERFFWSYNLNWTPAISAQLNDSIRLRLSGFNSTLSFGGDLIKSKVVDLCPSLGAGFQQLKLKVLKIQNPDSVAYAFNEGDYRIYRNSAPTLNAMLNLRINMGDFTVNFGGGYVLDCSSPRWRYNGKFLSDSPKTSMNGPVATFSIGIHIPSY